MLNLERLRALAAVAKHGSIAAAARALHVTPSGVSQQLAKLEREAGHTLLEPDGRSVRLTHAGQVLAGHAAVALRRLETAEAELADLRHEILGPLRIGALGSALRAFLPTALAQLAAEHPRLVPTVRDGEAVDLAPAVLNGELDLALIESWSNRPMPMPEGLAVRTLLTENVDVALSERHPLASVDRVRLDRQHLPWASCPPGTEPYEALVQALRGLGVEPRVRYMVAEFPTQLALIRANVAAALVPSIAQRPVPEGVRLVPTDPPLWRDVQVAWRAAPPVERAATTGPPTVVSADPLESASPAIRAAVTRLQAVARELAGDLPETSRTPGTLAGGGPGGDGRIGA